MKTIAQQLNAKKFPFFLHNQNGMVIYMETETGFWVKKQYNSQNQLTYLEDSKGFKYEAKYNYYNKCIKETITSHNGETTQYNYPDPTPTSTTHNTHNHTYTYKGI
mgnify:CR=1 FL=1